MTFCSEKFENGMTWGSCCESDFENIMKSNLSVGCESSHETSSILHPH
jgi:hypothetical protein